VAEFSCQMVHKFLVEFFRGIGGIDGFWGSILFQFLPEFLPRNLNFPLQS
jgi:hypothetical protein